MKIVLTGGFLGSGKTTAITHACTQLMNEGVKVAVITNDQGNQQVDSAHIQHHNIPVKEVSNGCFCCNYAQLEDHVLSLLNEFHPEIIFAESVGSCTDLISTIAKPFYRYQPDWEPVISVFADTSLLLAIMEGKASFVTEQVQYIYKKQLEEADILVLNKIDQIGREQLDIVHSIVQTDYPGKIILQQDSTDKKGIHKWIEHIIQFKRSAPLASLEIDYDMYASGEAQLAWLDTRMIITSPLLHAPSIALQITRAIYLAIQQEQWTIGHLKFYLEAKGWQQKISYTSTSVLPVTLSDTPAEQVCNLLINARIQTDPENLKNLVENIIKQTIGLYGCDIIQAIHSSFKPGYPKPTHRFV